MSNTNTGGPAFPEIRIVSGDNYNPPTKLYYGGMTLRDYFAAKAMQGLLSNPKLADEIMKRNKSGDNWIEKSAWGWADEVLKARDQ